MDDSSASQASTSSVDVPERECEARELYPFHAAPSVAIKTSANHEPPTSIFAIRDICYLIAEALPQPDFLSAASETDTIASHAARHNLYSLAMVSKELFYAATTFLWRTINDSRALFRALGVGLELDSPMALMSGAEIDAVLCPHVKQLLRPGNPLGRIALDHFRYYARKVQNLRIIVQDLPSTTLQYVQSLLPPGIVNLFPTLRQLTWVDFNPHPPFAVDISHFLHSTHLSCLTLVFDDQDEPLDTRAAQTSCGDAVCAFVATVKRMKPELRELCIYTPASVPVSSAILRGFRGIRKVDLQFPLARSASHARGNTRQRMPALTEVEQLDMLWTARGDAEALLAEVSLANVVHLSVNTCADPDYAFLEEALVLSTKTSLQLQTVDIVSAGYEWRALDCRCDFAVFLNSFVVHQNLRSIAICLPGYCFSFAQSHLDFMIRTWRQLEVLDLTFKLPPTYDDLPTLDVTIPHILSLCTRLKYLHLPGIVAGSDVREGFTIPCCPASRLRHLSSNQLHLRGPHVLDVAFELCKAFPCLEEVGPSNGEDHDGVWAQLDRLLHAVRYKDNYALLEQLLKIMHRTSSSSLP
ncbi:hypothetical protein OH77DRAFT_1523137 [Trametes cingulata]|nr:hypothetical protein OH77DRAFT_1523137 [Trametes cingulata]